MRHAEEFLDKAATLANVFIVTLAKPDWVDTCCKNFMEGLGGVLQKHKIKVIYAQENLTDAMKQEATQLTNVEQFTDFWTKVKRDAIRKELESFHNEAQISWENILSFGDSEFEISGTIGAGKDYIKKQINSWKEQSSGVAANQCAGHRSRRSGLSGLQLSGSCQIKTLPSASEACLTKLRIKTMKMLGKPTVEELMAQLTLLTRWLPHLVDKDSSVNLELENSEDDEHITNLNAEITGHSTELTWGSLCPYL
jgi:hypothetical protein